MSILVWAVYGLSVILALMLLYYFHASWYWHVLSVLAALAVGFSPPLPGWEAPSRDLVYGFVTLFLLVWGLGEPLFHHVHRQRMRHA